MKIDKLRSIREGHYKVISNQLEKIERAKENSDLIELNTIIDAISQRLGTIKEFNEKILEATEISEIEVEIVNAEEFCLDIKVKLQYFREFGKSLKADEQTTQNDNRNANVSRSTFNSNASMYQRLPKLTLPVFSGDILEWQSFWDAYESTVHLNSNLSEVQKFNYLKTQLDGNAARTIQGFSLTHVNYIQAVGLLKERFGQPHKIIHANIQALLNLPAPNNTLSSMRNFIDKLEAYIRGLESLGQCQSTYGTLIVPVIIDKLPADIRKNLARENGSDNWELQNLRNSLYRELNIMEAGQSAEIADDYRPTALFLTSARQNRAKTGSRQKPPYAQRRDQRQCIYCNENHHTNECSNVRDVKLRKDIIKKKHLCFNCLKNHHVVNCRSNYRCLKCKRKHHTSICESSPDSGVNTGTSEATHIATERQPPSQTEAAIFHSSSETRQDVLLKTAVAQVCTEKQYAEANILFDEGAQRSFISEKLAEKLNVKPNGSTVISLAAFGDTSQRLRHLDTTTIYLLTDAGAKIPLQVMIVPTIAVPILNVPQCVTSLPYLRNLKLAHPVINDDKFEISLLIGADYYWSIVGNHTIRGNGPTAVSSSIGYLLSGPVQTTHVQTQSCFALNLMATDIERFWKLESIGINSEEDENIDKLQTYQQNAITFKDGKYEAKLPWKEEHDPLPTNYEITKKRTESLIRRLRREPEILQKYAEIIQEQEKRDFIEKVNENEQVSSQKHYIPHHAVKKDSPTTPIRIVYDCSCRESAQKPSLNDCLDNTPPTLNDLSQILVRFRLGKYAISTDIEKAFLNVRLHKADRDVTRFLWLSDPNDPDSPLSTYRFKVVLFGATCSPFILSATLLKHLETNATNLVNRTLKPTYAISTDIEKAFLNVRLHKADRDVTRFLWLSDPNDPDSPLSTYRFKVVLFGATCSPFILSATLLKHLETNATNLVNRTLKRDLYVDNILSSFTTEDEVLRYFRETRDLMLQGSFNLRSWASNSHRLQTVAKEEGVLDNSEITKILGMLWFTDTDEISYPNRDIPIIPNVTKRAILQYTSRVYDPLGLLSPILIRAKILLQEVWKSKYTWDIVLPDDIQKKWLQLTHDINDVTNIRFPRHIFKSDRADDKSTADDTVLHVFVDASIQAYGAAAYLCRRHESTLIMAKSRVAPLKKLTLPKLELMAAVIGARLANHLLQTTKIPEVVFWSDSQIVLHWLNSSKPTARFVQNRVTEIKDLTLNRKWKYCPTQHNPADLLTRGIAASQYKENKSWMSGPDWLPYQSQWPIWKQSESVTMTTIADESPEADESEQPLQAKSPLQNGIHTVIDIAKYSSYKKLIRVTAYILRFIHNCKPATDKKQRERLTVTELHNAEHTWLQNCQRIEFSRELSNLKTNEKRLPLVRQLRLFIDDKGDLRCGGRIQNAPLEDATKFPYLLPTKHTLTRLLVRDAHERQLHSGANCTVTFLRQKFWIPSIRRCVMTEIRKCVTCKRVNGKPYKAPDPPPLPRFRLDDSAPFTVTGVDFTGALHVKDYRGNAIKAYICLFTCASTRALHLEVVQNLTESSFMQAFRRFCSRKSLPRIMVSDNATTYQAASRHLRQLFESQSMQEEISQMGTQWYFIPTRAPWYGGWWERLIGITKNTIKKILGCRYITLEELQTIVTEVEAVLNDRPITFVTSDVSDPLPLTPAHLLYGRQVVCLPSENASIESLSDATVSSHQSLTRRAKVQKQLIDQFRDRWRHEYLTALREYHRVTGNNHQTISPGDVVQIHDDTPRSRWRLGVIHELIYGKDGLIRAAKVRSKNEISVRPIVKLYPLETK